MKYFQCTLEKQEPKGIATTVSWLPEKFAKKDRVVKLKNRASGNWDDGWIVKYVGNICREKEEVIERSRDYTKQRNASDI